LIFWVLGKLRSINTDVTKSVARTTIARFTDIKLNLVVLFIFIVLNQVCCSNISRG